MTIVTRMRGGVHWAAFAAIAALATPASAAPEKARTPYYASIGAEKARMRTGPGRTYPSSWMYVRPGLPIKVIEVFKEWRKVEDPGGTQGWMLSALLRETRTAMIRDGIVELRDSPSPTARVAWRAEPGVVGRVGTCMRGWCRLDVKGQAGFVPVERLWGVDAGEVLP